MTRQLKDDFEALRVDHEALIDDIGKLMTDLELLRAGWKVHFVVDFHEVYRFAFRQEVLAGIYHRNKGRPSAEDRESYLRHQAALAFLFFGRRRESRPMLLPPHVVELRDHIVSHETQALDGQFDEQFEHEMGRRLLKRKDLAVAERFLEWHKAGRSETLLPAIQKTMSHIALNKFSAMMFRLSGITGNWRKRLRKLLDGDDPPLHLASDLVVEHRRLVLQVLESPPSRWYDVLGALRPLRPEANAADAKVIDLVLALNDELARRDPPEFVCLVSDAPKMVRALNLDRYPDESKRVEDASGGFRNPIAQHPVLGREARIHRSTNVFLLYMTAAEPGPPDYDRTLAQLDQMLRRVRSFQASDPYIDATVARCQQECTACDRQLNADCEAVSEMLREHRRLHDKTVNLSLIAHRLSHLPSEDVSFDNWNQTLAKFDRGVEALFLFLNGHSKFLDDLIEEREAATDQQRDSGMDRLSEKSVLMAPEVMAREVETYQRWRRVPFELRFQHEESKAIVGEMESLLTQPEPDFQQYASVRKRYLRLTRDEGLGLDGHLLLVMLFYNQGSFERVVQLSAVAMERIKVQQALEPARTDPGSWLSEFRLLHVLAAHQHRWERAVYEEALRDCEIGKQDYPKDWRFRYLEGVVRGRGLDEGLIPPGDRSPTDCLREARAMAGSEPVPFAQAVLSNVIAYSILMRDRPSAEDLAEAESEIQRMLVLVSDSEWPANFVDTRACLRYHRGMMKPDREAAARLLQSAVKGFDVALKRAKEQKLPPIEQRRIVKHRKDASERLAKLRESPG